MQNSADRVRRLASAGHVAKKKFATARTSVPRCTVGSAAFSARRATGSAFAHTGGSPPPQSTQGYERIIGVSCAGRPAEGGLIFFGQGEARRSGHISNRQGTGT